MRYYLLQSKINGIKSINKEITLEFYNSTVSKDLELMENHVKAIYGPNGAGKTAIAYAFEIYKNFFLGSSYLTMGNVNGVLMDLINKQNKEFSIENIFAEINDNNECETIYKHKIIIGDRGNENYELQYEYFGKLAGNRINLQDKYSTIFEIKDGEVASISKKIKNVDTLINETKNNLKMKSFLAAVSESKATKIDEEFKKYSLSLISFVASITVVLQESDRPNYINLKKIRSSLEKFDKKKNELDDKIFMELFAHQKIVDDVLDIIPKEYYEAYEKKIKKIANFIKVFKDDLVDIEVKPYENYENYECENIMIYSDGRRINKKFESTGIKKIIATYEAFCDLENGGIVVYDEFDANLHDVLLIKLIEYILEYSKGQFVFTTHNMAPMDMLQKKKHGIDFMSPDSKIVSWKKNGNYKASAMYRGGFIEYSPFNIEAFDFLGKFWEDNE